ncbi:hypothetical protein H1R20_g1914, partial [Candolleomyces eurysporus]
MATVAHTIYSHYDPDDRELLERETGQRPVDLENDAEAQWRNEAGQIYKKPTLAGAPVFVPAKIADGEWASYSASAPTLASTLKGKDEKESVAGWYKNLTAGVSANPSPGPSTSIAPTAPTNHNRPKYRTATDKNTWFIQNAISSASAPSSSSSIPLPFSIGSSDSASTTPAPPPTLADILERDPPPSNSDPKLKHPVWIALGPGNKGFGMLQRSGWNEGESLGPYAQRLRREKEIDVSTLLSDSEGTSGSGKLSKGKEREDRSTVKVEYVEVPIKGKRKRISPDDDDDIMELKKVEVVDLTEVSDEDSDEEEEEEEEEIEEASLEEGQDSQVDSYGHGGTALLTPISTILKTDKLGIGLKPKLTSSALTKGAYRVPVLKNTKRNQAYTVKSNGFRVTNTKNVMEEIRRREREERELWGRGKRGLERKKKREERDRRGLLAYMNE